jgi:DNA mismatch endonuclease Vsr
MDNLTKEQRRKNMRAIKATNSKIEVKLRKALWERGFRYRKNTKDVVGKPDIVFKSLKIAVFCDGEFFHGKDWEVRKSAIKSNSDYWIRKIERNIERDKEVNEQLRSNGWVIIRLWGKEIIKNTETCVDVIAQAVTERRKLKKS